MRRGLLVLALVACGPATPAAHTIHDKQAAPAFACPSVAPSIKADPTAGDALAGQAVVHVCVTGGSREARDAVSGSLGTKSGARLDLKRVHDDILALMDLPMIDDASASATRDASGLAVFFTIRERPVIADVAFEGVHAFTRTELDVAPLAVGQRLYIHAVRNFATALETAYGERGYGGAKVDYKVNPAEPGKVRVVISVQEGAPWRFGAIVFQGNKALTTAELAKTIAIKTGETWSADLLERAPLLAQALAYNRGLLESSVKVEHAAADTNGAVPITFTIKEGNVFTLRKLSITGVTPTVEKQLLAAMKTKPKTVFARDALMADMAAMRVTLGMDVEPRTELDAPSKSVDVVLEATKKTP